MTNGRKRSLSVLAATLMFTVMIGFIPQIAVPVYAAGNDAAEYPLWVGGEQVTSVNTGGDGWSFEGDASGGTLTLNNANITGSNKVNDTDEANISVLQGTGSDFNLTIELKGDNHLSGADTCIHFVSDGYGSLLITGEGSLEAIGAECGIYTYTTESTEIKGTNVTAKGSQSTGDGINCISLTITDSIVTAIGGDNGIVSNDKLTIADSKVTAVGTEGDGLYTGYRDSITLSGNSYVYAEASGSGGAVCCGDEIVLEDDLKLIVPENGEIKKDSDYDWRRVYDSDGALAAVAVFGKAYDLWVGGSQVTTENMRDLTVIEGVDAAEDGGVSFDPKTDTLTLNNANITGVYTGGRYDSCIYSDDIDLTISLSGENTVGDGTAYDAIFTDGGSLTVTGKEGSMTAEGSTNGIAAVTSKLMITDTDVTVKAIDPQYGNGGTGIHSYGLEIKNSTVNTEAEVGILSGVNKLTITDSKVNVAGTLMGILGDGISISGNSTVTADMTGADSTSNAIALWSTEDISLADVEIAEPKEGTIVETSDDAWGAGTTILEKDGSISKKVTITKVYTVTFVDGQGNTLNTEKVESGQAATAPADPTREGYTFNGWDKDFSEVTSDLTVTAKWEKNAEPAPQPQPQPAKTTSGTLMAKITAKGGNSLVLTWTQIKGAEGYDVFFIKCSKETPKKVKTIKGNKTFKWTKKGLKKKTAYKAVVKAYVTKNGKKTYVGTSPLVHAYTSGGTKNYTNSKSVTVRKTKVTLKKGNSYKIKAGVKKLQSGKKLMTARHEAKLRYLSTDTGIATVSKKGKITAKGKGTCKIYVYAVNGARKAISVTVQ